MNSPGHNGSRITFFGANVDLLSLDEVVARAEAAMARKRPIRHTALNVAKLVKMRSDTDLSNDVNTSDIVGIDGQGIVYGLRMFGVKSAERVAGIDLFYALLDHCARTHRRPFTPDPAEVEHARAVIDAFAAPENAGKGVITVAGKMTERLHLEEAKRLVAIDDAIASRSKSV